MGVWSALALTSLLSLGNNVPRLRAPCPAPVPLASASAPPRLLASSPPPNLRHPANIAIARAKLLPDSSIELTVSFDILAFTLDQTPTLVLDAPMNALLDGPSDDLDERLTDAKQRFLEGLGIGNNDHPGAVDKVDFPTAADVHRAADEGQQPRLPVMMSATLRCHLAPREKKLALTFADVLGTVILSTEFPYQEPLSEPVEPGEWSTPLALPTAAETEALKAASRPREAPSDEPLGITEAQAKAGIQIQYDAWSKAYMAHDLDTLFGILAPAYTLKTAKGALITRPEYEVMLKLRKQKHSDTTHYSTEILRINLRGSVAAIWSRETTTDPGKNGVTGKDEPVSYLHDYVDVGKWTKGKWLLKSTVTQTETVIPTVR